MDRNVNQKIGELFLQVADAIETGRFGNKLKIGLTTLGSEHGVMNLVKGAEIANQTDDSFDIVLIGPKVETNLEIIEVCDEKEMHSKMEELLDKGIIDGCVTMHYNFPLGVSTVGKVITPAQGRELFLSTTTGSSSTKRVESMVKNAIHGMIAAKAMGLKDPTLGILNLDGARQVEKVLLELKSNGYEINFAGSVRADGGAIMRGNDLLCGSADIMVLDTLTGNIMMKMLSSYTTGGSYEASGYGYGPGIGEDYDRLILIVSRASGVPVVANALKYAARLARGKVLEVAKDEFEKAKKANLDGILQSLTKTEKVEKTEAVAAPTKEVVTADISGIDIMSLEDAVQALWRSEIYAESGMGCTGPIVLVNEKNRGLAEEVLRKESYI